MSRARSGKVISSKSQEPSHQSASRLEESKSEDESESDSCSPVHASSSKIVNQSVKHKRQKIDVPPHLIDWAKQGLYEVPAICCLSNINRIDETDDNSVQGPMMVKLIMIFHHKKEPFTKLQLRKHFARYFDNDAFEDSFEVAKKLLLEDFGLVLAEIQPGKPVFAASDASTEKESQNEGDEEAGPSRGRSTRTPGVSYILINTAKPEHCLINAAKRDHAYLRKSDPKESARISSLSLILMYIYMEGGWIGEDHLIVFLRLFGFDWDATHPLVGSVKSMLTTFDKQGFLIREKFHTSKKAGAPESMRYKWGARADLEISRLEMIGMCAKVLGVTADIDHFGERYTNAVSVERRRLAKIESLIKDH